MDFFLEITGDNVSKIVESTRQLWTLNSRRRCYRAGVEGAVHLRPQAVTPDRGRSRSAEPTRRVNSLPGGLEGRNVGEALLKVRPKRPLRCELCI